MRLPVRDLPGSLRISILLEISFKQPSPFFSWGKETSLGVTANSSYILMQVPSNLFLDKIGKPSIYLPACMVVWGAISACTGAVKDFGGLIACRFFLGFVEAAYFPGCLFFLSSWYTRKELGFRTAILYSGSLISGAFSGLIAAGIVGGLDGARGLRAWRWLFVIPHKKG